MVWSFQVMKNSLLWRCHGLLGLTLWGFLSGSFVMFFLWSFVMVLGSILILGDALTLYIIFIILIQYPFLNQGFWGLIFKYVIISNYNRLFRHVPPQVPPTWGGGEVHDGTSRHVPPQVPPPVKIILIIVQTGSS